MRNGVAPTPYREVDTIPQKRIRRLKARAERDPHAILNLIREQRKAFAVGFLTPFERDIEVRLLIAVDTEALLAAVC